MSTNTIAAHVAPRLSDWLHHLYRRFGAYGRTLLQRLYALRMAQAREELRRLARSVEHYDPGLAQDLYFAASRDDVFER